MFETLDSIRQQLRAGEDSYSEFKEIRLGDRSVISPNTEDFAGEMVAFANADGGVLFLGVADDGSVRGIPAGALATVEQWVLNVASNNCDPPIRPVLRRTLLPGRDGTEAEILLVEVRRSVFAHQTSGGRTYVRVGSTKQGLKMHEIGRLLQQRGRAFVFDEQVVATTTTDALDPRLVEKFFFGAYDLPLADLMRNTRIVSADEEGMDRPTVAGLLAFGKNPREHLPPAYIEAAVYRGAELTSDDLVNSQAIEGPVGVQIEDGLSFVDRFMLKPARKSVGREDFPQYDLSVIYEALVNAVAHRDYSIAGSKIRLYLFADRLELYSPGALPNSLTLETMPFRVFTRNQLLVSFLSRMRARRTNRVFIESRGEGVRRILREGERHAGRRPEYRQFGDELLLTIWAQPSPHEGRPEPT